MAGRAVETLAHIPLTDLHKAEHFGFRDGISQPILEGTRMARERPDSHHIVKLGEILVGHPDNGGFVAPTPALSDNAQFGTNGTYLVCRQLEQDVASFHAFAAYAAQAAGRTGACGVEFVKAKMLGRWLDGRPLVPGHSISAGADNEFGFYQNDRDGLDCPIGAHIRRANPRDTLDTDDKDRWKASNRHRVLRRGRSYGPKWEPDETPAKSRGLLFVGLNADIERQFEFIQHNWLNDPAFGGLLDESDPVVGEGHALTIPDCPARLRPTGLGRFVTTVGGEYFFLPGMRALRFLAGT